MIQDKNDSNSFKLEVYDNNYPGETRYINIKRSKYSKFQLNYTAWVNDYNYTFTYDYDDDGDEDETEVQILKPTIE